MGTTTSKVGSIFQPTQTNAFLYLPWPSITGVWCSSHMVFTQKNGGGSWLWTSDKRLPTGLFAALQKPICLITKTHAIFRPLCFGLPRNNLASRVFAKANSHAQFGLFILPICSCRKWLVLAHTQFNGCCGPNQRQIMYSIITSRARICLHSSPPQRSTLKSTPKRRLSCFSFHPRPGNSHSDIRHESITPRHPSIWSNFNGDNYRFPSINGDGTTYQRFTQETILLGISTNIELHFQNYIRSFSDWETKIAVEIWSSNQMVARSRHHTLPFHLGILSLECGFFGPEKAHLSRKSIFHVVRRVLFTHIRGKFHQQVMTRRWWFSGRFGKMQRL